MNCEQEKEKSQYKTSLTIFWHMGHLRPVFSGSCSIEARGCCSAAVCELFYPIRGQHSGHMTRPDQS